MKHLKLFCAVALLACCANAMPVVTYTVSGSAGNWTLDFNVDNTTDQGVYFFGVLLSAPGITGSPSVDWDPTVWATWDNSPYGGSSTVYNNNWINDTSSIAAGDSLSGFQVLVTDATAPTSVSWFAFACDSSDTCQGSPYDGQDFFNTVDNPGFEGIAGVGSAVPEPATLSLIAAGLAGIGLIGSRRRRALDRSR